MKTQGEEDTYKPRREVSEGANTAYTPTMDFQSPDMWRNEFLLHKPPSLWYSFMEDTLFTETKVLRGLWVFTIEGLCLPCLPRALRESPVPGLQDTQSVFVQSVNESEQTFLELTPSRWSHFARESYQCDYRKCCCVPKGYRGLSMIINLWGGVEAVLMKTKPFLICFLLSLSTIALRMSMLNWYFFSWK